MALDVLVRFPDSLRLPLAGWVDALVDWMMVVWAPLFDRIADAIRVPLLALEGFLQGLPWSLVVVAFAAAAWRVGGARMALGVAGGLIAIGALGLWNLAMSTLALVMAATLLAVLVALPVGILMARYDRIEDLMRPLLDLMQTMPSFVYLIPAIMFFSIGKVPALLATFVYAVPPAIRLTNLGIRQVEREVIEAGQAFGATSWQLLAKVQLPLALPAIMAGINQTIMMALAMVVIASMIGAGGLGGEVLNGIARLEVGRGFVAGSSIVILAIVIDRISQRLVRARPATAGE